MVLFGHEMKLSTSLYLIPFSVRKRVDFRSQISDFIIPSEYFPVSDRLKPHA